MENVLISNLMENLIVQFMHKTTSSSNVNSAVMLLSGFAGGLHISVNLAIEWQETM